MTVMRIVNKEKEKIKYKKRSKIIKTIEMNMKVKIK